MIKQHEQDLKDCFRKRHDCCNIRNLKFQTIFYINKKKKTDKITNRIQFQQYNHDSIKSYSFNTNVWKDKNNNC